LHSNSTTFLVPSALTLQSSLNLHIHDFLLVAVGRHAQSPLTTICKLCTIPYFFFALPITFLWITYRIYASGIINWRFAGRFAIGSLSVFMVLILPLWGLGVLFTAKQVNLVGESWRASGRTCQSAQDNFFGTMCALLPKFQLVVLHGLSGAVGAYCCWQSSHPDHAMLYRASADCVNEVGVHMLFTGLVAGVYKGYCFFANEESVLAFSMLQTGKYIPLRESLPRSVWSSITYGVLSTLSMLVLRHFAGSYMIRKVAWIYDEDPTNFAVCHAPLPASQLVAPILLAMTKIYFYWDFSLRMLKVFLTQPLNFRHAPPRPFGWSADEAMQVLLDGLELKVDPTAVVVAKATKNVAVDHTRNRSTEDVFLRQAIQVLLSLAHD
jgi:hypothetical protein